MAEKKAGGLYMRIGLTLSRLQSDFLAAEQTVKQGIAALNRQQNIVRLRMEADTAELDAVADKTKILEIQERSLTQILDMQRDKLRLASAAYQDVAKSKGENSTVAKQLEASVERERLAVARLEAQLKSLSAQKITFDAAQLQNGISKLNAKIQNIRLKAEIDTSKLKSAGEVFDAQKVHVAALTKELELQRQKLIELQAQMYKSAQQNGANSATTLNFKSNVLRQIQEINQLQTKLREVQNTNINVQVRADSLRRVEAEVAEKIALLNARLEHVKVKTDIDVSKLGSAASEFARAKVQVQGLNRELELQNQKLAQMRQALNASVNANGLNNVKTINLQTEIQKQIQAIDQLKAKINELNKIQPPKTNSLLSGYLNIKGDVAGKVNQLTTAFNGLTSASHSADGAITKTLEIISAIPHPVGKAVAAFAAIPLVIHGVENSLLSMAKAYISSGDSLYVMSRGMQLSTSDMGKLSTIAKVTGIDITEVNTALRRFSMQMTKAGEKNSLMMQTMKRYGAELYDANGHMKDAIGLADELGKALKKAQEEGNGAAFRDIVGGKFWSADFITFLEDFADNQKLAAEIVKNGLANPTWAHQIQGELNALNAQAAQTGNVFSSALMPVAAEIVPHMRKQFAELANVIKENKDNVKFFGDAMALPVRILHELTDGVISLSQAIDKAKDSGTTLGKVLDGYAKKRDDIAALMNVAPMTALSSFFSPLPIDVYLAQYRDEIDEFKRKRAELEEEAKAKNDERLARFASSPNLSALSEAERSKLLSTVQTMHDEIVKREQEAADIIYKINHGSYENRLRDLENFRSEQLKIIEDTESQLEETLGGEVNLAEERVALEKNVAAKRQQIEHEREQYLAEIRQRITAADRTELENRMIAIEDEKQAWIDAGMEKVEAEKLAQKQLNDYLKKSQEELTTTITSLYQTELEKRLSQIEKERQAWIDKCDDEVQATKLAEQEKADAQRSAAMQVIKQQADAYKAYQEGGFKGLQAYNMAQLAKSGVDLDYLNMTPEQLMSFQKAQQVAEKSMLPNFMTDADKEMYRQQLVADQQRARNYDEQNYAIVNGVKVGLAEALGGKPVNITLKDGSELKVSADGNSGSLTDEKTSNNGEQTVTTERNFDLPQIFDDVSQSFSGIPQATQGVIDSFSAVPEAVQGVSEVLSGLKIPQMDEITNPLAGLDPEIQATVQQFSAMNTKVDDVVVKLSDLSAVIASLQLSKENSAPNERTPVAVNVNVAINEAHAWDSEHIQELSEKVASELEPRIVGAIGGDDNSY